MPDNREAFQEEGEASQPARTSAPDVPRDEQPGGSSSSSAPFPPPPPPPPPAAETQGEMGQRRKPKERCLTEDEIERLKVAFCECSATGADRVISKLLGIPFTKLDLARKAVAEAMFTGKMTAVADLCSGCLTSSRYRGVTPLLAAHFRAWDETQLWTSVRTATDPVRQQKQWHCMSALFSFLLLVQSPEANAAVDHLIIFGSLPTILIALQRQTGELLKAGLDRIGQIHRLEELFAKFDRRAQVGCSDRAGANFRVSDDAVLRHLGWSELQLGCQAHDGHHVTEDLFALRSRFLPRIARATGSLAIGGTIARFSEILCEWLDQNVDRQVGGAISEEAERYRRSLIDLFWPEPPEGLGYLATMRARLRRLIMLRLPNGEWRPGHRTEKLVHLCAGAECCASDEDCKRKFKTYFVAATLPYASIMVSQHRCS